MKLRIEKSRKPPRVPPSPRVSRNPYEVWLMISFIAWSAGIAFFGPPAAGVILSLPDWVRYFIAAFIAIGAVICLIGIYFPDIIMAAFLEFAGLAGITGPLTIYVGNIISNAEDWQAGLGAIALIFLLICGVHRGWDVYRWLVYTYRRPNILRDNENDGEPE